MFIFGIIILINQNEGKKNLFTSEPSFMKRTVQLYYKQVRHYKSCSTDITLPSNQYLPVQKYKDNSNVPQVLWHTQLAKWVNT